MGFRLATCFSSPVDAEAKKAILAEARSRWPFVRLPRRDVQYTQHVQFAPPELTDYLFDTDEEYEQAVEQNGDVEDGLPMFSEQFHDVTFAFIDVGCFGGTCLYTGFVCKNGEITVRQDGEQSGHRPLLEQVGIILERDYFAPFERRYLNER